VAKLVRRRRRQERLAARARPPSQSFQPTPWLAPVMPPVPSHLPPSPHAIPRPNLVALAAASDRPSSPTLSPPDSSLHMALATPLLTPLLSRATSSTGTPALTATAPASGRSTPRKGGGSVVLGRHSWGRPPWYNQHGQAATSYVIGIAGGSASGKVSQPARPFAQPKSRDTRR